MLRRKVSWLTQETVQATNFPLTISLEKIFLREGEPFREPITPHKTQKIITQGRCYLWRGYCRGAVPLPSSSWSSVLCRVWHTREYPSRLRCR